MTNDLIEKVFKTSRYYYARTKVGLRDIRFSIRPVSLYKPIFVVGCSRAGTTLVYKTMSESKELGSLNKETHDFWSSLHPLDQVEWNTHEVSESSACEKDRLAASQLFYTQTGRRRIVDKSNQNGLSIPFLYQLFPDAHFVFIHRNPGDNIESLIRGWGKPDEFATWSENIPKSVNIDNGFYNRWCFFLAEDWRNYCKSSIEDVCAYQYSVMNKAILRARLTVRESQWHQISYEEIINDPVKSFQKLFESCGLTFDARLKLHCQSILDRPYNT